MTLSSKLNNAKFAVVFLENYLVGGLGSLPKREIDLLVLRAYLEATLNVPIQTALAKADPYQLGRELNIRATRIRIMLDDLRYRYAPTDEDLNFQLLEALKEGEVVIDKNYVRIQIDDLLLRDHVRKIVKENLGIVDTSFDRTIISLTPDKFLALAVSTQDRATQEELEKRLKAFRLKSDIAASKEGPVTWFIKKIGEGAANEIGKKILDEVPSWITYKGKDFVDFIMKLAENSPG